MGGEPQAGGVTQRLTNSIVVGAGAVAALLAVITIALTIGGVIGLTDIPAIVAGLLVLAVIGLALVVKAQERRFKAAFPWHDAARKADAIKDFGVKPWSGWPGKEPPPFVERTVAEEIGLGLDSSRFVLLTGERKSGKSRLIYEIARNRSKQIALISTPFASDGDLLGDVLDERLGLATWEGRQILFVRDFAKRLAARHITADSLRTWLELHSQLSIVATLNPREHEQHIDGDEEAEASLSELREVATVVQLGAELDDAEYARAQELFRGLEPRQLRQLPRYMVAEHPLRERFADRADGFELGRAIVRAAADWKRIGVPRLTSRNFLFHVVSNGKFVAAADFAQALEWAAKPVRGKASLLYAVQTQDGEHAYEADQVICDLLDLENEPEPIPATTWEAAFEDIVENGADDRPDEVIVSELIPLGEAALARGNQEFGRWVLKASRAAGSVAQKQRCARTLTRGVGIPSVIRLLVDSRREDSIAARIKTARRHSAERQSLASKSDNAERPSPALAAIYRRRLMRAVARVTVLIMADVFSATVGLAVGLAVRGGLPPTIVEIDSLLDIVWRSFVPWGAATIFVFALVTLYKQDAPRARLDAILLATGILGAIGLFTAASTDFDAVSALSGALVGTLVATCIDYGLRIAYDAKSRGWVRDHGLSAHTLLLGGPEEAAAIEEALGEGSTRPTKVCGYLTPGDHCDPAKSGDYAKVPAKEWLGSIADFAEVVVDKEIGRVIIVDPEMPPHQRQALADRCHLRNIPVEAVPSLSDIQAGAAEYVTGQSLILMPLPPLWQGHTAFVAKRVLDLAVALLVLVALSPLLLVITLLIVLVDRRAPFTMHAWRPGAGREVFAMYRFQTSIERRRAPLGRGKPVEVKEEEEEEVEDHPTWLGARLRNRGLDELPQLFNILRGDMSLVGPRPLRLVDDARLQNGELLRYVVRPGATGPWQVSGRREINLSELTSLDLAYLRHWTISADLEILVKTMRVVFCGRPQLKVSTEDREEAAELIPDRAEGVA